jgi:hypothetical protein
MFSTRPVLSLFLSAALVVTSLPLTAAAQAPTSQAGQISGMARGSNGQPLVNQAARLRNLDNGQIAANSTTNATGQFSFAGLSSGNYVVEIVDAAGSIVGTTSPISLTPAAMVATGVTATATTSTIASIVSSLGLGSFFTSTAGIITAAAIAGGVTAGVVSTRASASTSR